jgi:hypothetical protein
MSLLVQQIIEIDQEFLMISHNLLKTLNLKHLILINTIHPALRLQHPIHNHPILPNKINLMHIINAKGKLHKIPIDFPQLGNGHFPTKIMQRLIEAHLMEQLLGVLVEVGKTED